MPHTMTPTRNRGIDMRVMFDGITPSAAPDGGDLYAGYVNGRWPSYQGMIDRFPHAVHVSIAVSADADAQVLDVERYDATPLQVPDWVMRQRHRGIDPSVYVSASPWGEVRQACQRAGIIEPHYWIANYTNGPIIPDGAHAVQWRNTPGWDQSLVRDYWPGIDPPQPVIPLHPTPEGETMLLLMQYTGGDVANHDAIYLSNLITQRWVTDPGDLADVQASMAARGMVATVHTVTSPRAHYGVIVGTDPEHH